MTTHAYSQLYLSKASRAVGNMLHDAILEFGMNGVDFLKRFWHRDCVAKLSLHAFSEAYQKWCKRAGYRFHEATAEKIYYSAQSAVATFPRNESTKLLITQAVNCLNAVYESMEALRGEMLRLASLLPEFDVISPAPCMAMTTSNSGSREARRSISPRRIYSAS